MSAIIANFIRWRVRYPAPAAYLSNSSSISACVAVSITWQPQHIFYCRCSAFLNVKSADYSDYCGGGLGGMVGGRTPTRQSSGKPVGYRIDDN